MRRILYIKRCFPEFEIKTEIDDDSLANNEVLVCLTQNRKFLQLI